MNQRNVRNVLRLVFAGKMDVPQGAPAEAPAAPETAPADEPKGSPIQENTKYYYYYNAPVGKDINFRDIDKILNGKDIEAKKELIEKLRGGNITPFSASYFTWKKLAVLTNKFSPGGKQKTVYQVDLAPNGSKVDGTEDVSGYQAEGGASPAEIEEGLELFQNKEGDTVVSVKNSSDAMFFNGDPPTKEVIKGRLLNNAVPSGGGTNYDTFSKSSDDYRVWTSKNKLVTPEYKVPKDDGVRGGYYAGGEQSYKAFVAQHEQALEEAPTEEPSMKDKMQQAPETPSKPETEQPVEEPSEEAPEQPATAKKTPTPVKPGFVPVDVQEKRHEKKKRKEKGIKGPEDMPSGQVPEMARMSGDIMKIKRMARRVLAAYLSEDKDAQTSPVSPATTGVTPGTSTGRTDPRSTRKKLQTEIKKMQKQIPVLQQADKALGTLENIPMPS